MKRRITLLSLLAFAFFTLSACSISFESANSGSTRTSGGVYKTVNSGEVWRQMASIATTGSTALTFNTENTIALTIDPQDVQAIYVGTENSGMLFSFDAGASWSVARSLGKRKIQSIAVSPSDKCTIFTASENKIFRSDDCSRSWQEIYFDDNQAIIISSLAFDPANENTIYAGNSRGEVIASVNGGKSWSALQRFSDSKNNEDNVVIKVLVSEKNPNNIWAATRGSGIYKSEDKGQTWRGFIEEFAEIHTKSANKINDLSLSQADGKTVIAATDAGLIRSFDGGGNWQLIDLVPPSKSTVINSVAIFYNDSKIIYYITDTSFGWSEDNGVTWSSKKLPTGRRGISLAVDYENPDIIYLGVKEPVEEK